MDEQTENQTQPNTQQSETTPAENSGGQQAANNPVEQADKVAERLEQANKKREELIKREENLEARRRLGGETYGQQTTPQNKEYSPQEYAEKALQGEVPE